jgi:predicted dehydrogenase
MMRIMNQNQANARSSSDRRVAFGLLGLSRIAKRRLLPALLSQSRFTLVAVGTSQQEQHDLSAFGSVRTCDYASLIDDPSIEVVYVSAPPRLHIPWVRRALEAGKNVICDKPLGSEAAEVREIVDLASARGLWVEESLLWHYHPVIAWLRRFVEECSSEHSLLEMTFTIPPVGLNDWRYSAELGGGPINEMGSYAASLGRAVLGIPASAVLAATVRSDALVEHAFNAIIEYGRSARGVVSAGIGFEYVSAMRVITERGWAFAPRVYSLPADMPVVVDWQRAGARGATTIEAADAWGLFIEAVGRSDRDRDAAMSEIVERASFLSALRRSARLGSRQALSIEKCHE